MTKTQHLCDMCHKDLDKDRHFYSYLASFFNTRLRKIKLLKRSPDPYNYCEYDYELCFECGEKVINFILEESNDA